MNTATQEKVQQQDGQTAGAGGQAPALVERMPRGERIVVESKVPVLDTAMFDHMMRIAKLMASSGLVPEHLNTDMPESEAIANCFLVVNQAVRWNMDPFAVAQHTYVLKGKLGYEGKLIAAMINTHPRIIKRLSYHYEGTVGTQKRKITVTARLSSDEEDRSISGTVEDWKTNNEQWTGDADQILSYRGAREWARRHLPEAILGVYADDELEQFTTTGARVQGEQPAQPRRGASGLKDALGAGAANATDATVITGETRDATEAGADAVAGTAAETAEKKKPEGTLEQRAALLIKFENCKDIEVLELAGDSARDFEWTRADQEVINAAYKSRAEELGEKT